jgi:adenosylhomocysteine nucleosidase
MDCRLLILTALLQEARALARAFSLRGKFTEAMESDGQVGVCLVGVGGRRLSEAAGQIHAQGVVLAGVGGGLAPQVRAGDVVVCGSAVALPGHGQGWKVHFGKVCTVRDAVCTPAEKAALFRETGALAVDMETQAAAEFAERMRAPFLVVRGISDAADESLDGDLLRLVDDSGRPRLGRVAGLLLRRPLRLSSLLRMKRATECALSHVADTVVAVAASGWPATATRESLEKIKK